MSNREKYQRGYDAGFYGQSKDPSFSKSVWYRKGYNQGVYMSRLRDCGVDIFDCEEALG